MDQIIVRATLATKRNPVAESNARQGFRRNICTFSGAPCGDECPRHQRHLTIACIVREHARLVSLSADRNKDCARIRASSEPSCHASVPLRRALVIGALLILFLAALPWIGWLAWLLVPLLGMGAVLLARRDTCHGGAAAGA